MWQNKTVFILIGWLFFGFTGCAPTAKSTSQKARSKKESAQKVVTGASKVAFDETFFSGLSAKYAGDSKAAMAYFQQCLTIDGENTTVKYELSQVYIKLNYVDNAIAMAEQIVDKEPQNRWFLENLAGAYKFGGRYDPCAKVYAQLVQQYPKEISYYYELGSAYLYANNISPAIDTYERIIQNFGFENGIAEQLYKLYSLQKLNQKSEKILKELVAFNPGDVQYITMLAHFYNEQGQTEKSIALYEELKSRNPDDPYVKLALYEYYVSINQQEKAFSNLEEAFSSKKVDENAKLSMVLVMADQAATSPVMEQEVYELLDILGATHPNSARVWAIYGEFLNSKGKKVQAREKFLKSIAIDSNQYQTWNQLLFLDSDLNDTPALLAHSLACMELFPNQVFPYFFSGVVYLQDQNYTKAVKQLERAKVLSPGIRELDIQILASLGDAYYQLGNIQKAWLSYDNALRMDPSNDYVLNNYAYFLSVHQENLEKALEMSAKTVANNPNNAVYLDTYGWIYFQLGDYANAVKYLKLAVKNDGTSSGEIFEHLGDALYKLGNVDEALLNWKMAARKEGASPKIDQKIRFKKIPE